VTTMAPLSNFTRAVGSGEASPGSSGPRADDLPIRFGPLVSRRDDAAMRAFREYGLGQFLHFGVYSLAGNEWDGVSARTGAPASEWIRAWTGPTAPAGWKDTYDNLYRQFNPANFDAVRWARQAKDMGARYVIFTTKHHDGFALWPTAFSDYNISRSPYPGDMVREIVDAYTAEGIDVFLYFSVLEWDNPDYVVGVPGTPEEVARFDRFLAYTRNQLLELLDRYPEAKGFWMDGTWDPSWVASHEFTHRLERELRERRPGLVIGSRLRNDEHGARHFDSNGRLLGDYEQGWERKLPDSYEALNGNDWDCVMSLPPNGWGYLRDWSGLYAKTSDDVIELLMRCRSMDGNFVVNFGPDGSGAMRPEEDRLAREVGAWVRANAEAVYPARHADLPTSKLGYLTQNGDILYLALFNRPVNNVARLAVPKDATQVPVRASLLTNGQILEVRHADIGFDLDPHTYYDVILPSGFSTDRAFVVRMDLGTPTTTAEELMVAKM